jgi:hypothetical protein
MGIYYLCPMKKMILFFWSIILLFACNKTNTAIKERIENADSVAINYFKGDGSMDSVAAVKIIKDKVLLSKLTSFVSEATISKGSDCGLDGSLHFFKMDRVIQDIDFVMNDNGCNQFIFRLNIGGAWNLTKLSPEAKTLLLSFKKR